MMQFSGAMSGARTGGGSGAVAFKGCRDEAAVLSRLHGRGSDSYRKEGTVCQGARQGCNGWFWTAATRRRFGIRQARIALHAAEDRQTYSRIVGPEPECSKAAPGRRSPKRRQTPYEMQRQHK